MHAGTQNKVHMLHVQSHDYSDIVKNNTVLLETHPHCYMFDLGFSFGHCTFGSLCVCVRSIFFVCVTAACEVLTYSLRTHEFYK